MEEKIEKQGREEQTAGQWIVVAISNGKCKGANGMQGIPVGTTPKKKTAVERILRQQGYTRRVLRRKRDRCVVVRQASIEMGVPMPESRSRKDVSNRNDSI